MIHTNQFNHTFLVLYIKNLFCLPTKHQTTSQLAAQKISVAVYQSMNKMLAPPVCKVLLLQGLLL
jgi:hypothetical protein